MTVAFRISHPENQQGKNSYARKYDSQQERTKNPLRMLQHSEKPGKMLLKDQVSHRKIYSYNRNMEVQVFKGSTKGKCG